MPLSELHSVYHHHDVIARFERPRDFDDGPSLAGRVRGALGEALLLSPTRKDQLPSAYQAMFGSDLIAPERALSPHQPCRPFTLFTEQSGKTVDVVLRFFGRGSVWVPEARSALHRALCESGIAIAPLSRVRAVLNGADLFERSGVLPLPPTPGTTRIVCRTPCVLARRGRASWMSSTLCGSLVSRGIAIADWCGARLDEPWGQFSDSQFELSDMDLSPLSWQRFSNRQKARVDMVGMVGSFSLRFDMPQIGGLIALAQVAGLGQQTSFGLGRLAQPIVCN